MYGIMSFWNTTIAFQHTYATENHRYTNKLEAKCTLHVNLRTQPPDKEKHLSEPQCKQYENTR